MRPNWEDASPWANYLTCDMGMGAYVRWLWHEERPTLNVYRWDAIGRSIPAHQSLAPTIEVRPVVILLAGSENLPHQEPKP